jgi:hypothetical protein
MASKTTSSKNTNKPSKGKKSNMSTATGGQQKNKNTPLETALAVQILGLEPQVLWVHCE